MKKIIIFLTLLSTFACAESFVKKIDLKAEGSSSGVMMDVITCEDNSTISVYVLNGQWHDSRLNVWGDANETLEHLAESLCEP